MSTRLFNQAGKKADPELWHQPKVGTGGTLTAGASDGVKGVDEGDRYFLTNTDSTESAYVGYDDLSNADNRLWYVGPGKSIGINVPIGVDEIRARRTGDADVVLHIVEVHSVS